MQTKELARALGGFFFGELAEFLVNPEIGVRRIGREYTRSLMAEFGNQTQEMDATRVTKDFRSARRTVVRELVAEKYREKILDFARRRGLLETEELPVTATKIPGGRE